MNAAAVELSGIGKSYGAVQAVEDVDLVLRAGECVALAGHNGAGKSTLVKLMLGLIRPTRGAVTVLGEDPSSPAARRPDIGYLPENVALHPSLTGAETLAFYARLKRQPPDGARALLDRVGLAHAAHRRVATYSKGMRQRLGLAQALLGPPRLLLLDEPTTGLDPASRQSFYEVVAELRDNGAAVLLSSHALAELEGQADRIVIMNRGRKVADGALSELRRLASLPVAIRIRLGAHAPARCKTDTGETGPLAGWRALGGGAFERRCQDAEKAAAIQALGALGAPIEDIEIEAPGLDDLYAHFLRREAS